MRQPTKMSLLIPLIAGVCLFSLFFVWFSGQPSYRTGAGIVGIYVFVGNPSFSSPTVPGMVYAIDIENIGGWGYDTIDKYVYLTNESLGGLWNLLWTNEPNIPIGTRVEVVGEFWHRTDVAGRRITLLEYTLIGEII